MDHDQLFAKDEHQELLVHAGRGDTPVSAARQVSGAYLGRAAPKASMACLALQGLQDRLESPVRQALPGQRARPDPVPRDQQG